MFPEDNQHTAMELWHSGTLCMRGQDLARHCRSRGIVGDSDRLLILCCSGGGCKKTHVFSACSGMGGMEQA